MVADGAAVRTQNLMDCPYYEQLQYGRHASALIAYLTADDRRSATPRASMHREFRKDSRSRFPSSCPRSSTFSLFWINMLHDYFMLRDDPAFVRTLLPGTRG
jgi:hypothetical protein